MTNLVLCERFQTWVSEEPAMLIVQDMKKHRLLWFDLRGSPNFTKPLFTVNTIKGDIVEIAQKTGLAIIGTSFTEKLEWRRSTSETPDLKRQSLLKWVDPGTRKQGTIKLEPNTLVDRVSADGTRLLAVKADAAQILDRQTGDKVGSVQVKKIETDDLMEFGLDGGSVVVRSEANRILIGKLNNEQTLQEMTLSLPASVIDAIFDSSGRVLAISSDDKNVRVWPRVALRQKPLALSGGPPKPDPETVPHSTLRRTVQMRTIS